MESPPDKRNLFATGLRERPAALVVEGCNYERGVTHTTIEQYCIQIRVRPKHSRARQADKEPG